MTDDAGAVPTPVQRPVLKNTHGVRQVRAMQLECSSGRGDFSRVERGPPPSLVALSSAASVR